VIGVACRGDNETGRLFLVERTEAFENGPGRFEGDLLAHNLDNVGFVLDAGDDVLGKGRAHFFIGSPGLKIYCLSDNLK